MDNIEIHWEEYSHFDSSSQQYYTPLFNSRVVNINNQMYKDK